jgi:tRNA (guanosine-2'-O-)-methyltransferase
MSLRALPNGVERLLASPEGRARLLARVEGFLTDERRARLDAALGQRTRLVCVALEDIYQGHNASAILRSCEGFGVQDVHIVEGRNAFQANDEISLGAAQWLTLRRHTSTLQAVAALRSEGRRIAATVADPAAPRLQDLPLDEPLALCFGTELQGLSPEMLAAADLRVHIPMCGLTQSFNVSVSVAICLFELLHRVRALPADHWKLDAEDAARLRALWRLRASDAAWRVAEEMADTAAEV